MSTYEESYTHKISSQKIGWYGQYTKESLDFCDTYSFDFDTNNIDSLFGINQHNEYYGKSGSNTTINCGSGVVIYTNSRVRNPIEEFHYGYLDAPKNEDGEELPPLLIKPPRSNFEEFVVKYATDAFKETEGTYKLTDIFRENQPVYKNLENGWYIFFYDGRFRLTNALENYTKGLTGQRNKPNGIFIAEFSNNQYAIAEGVEQLTNKLCKVNARYMVRKSTGAYFEVKKSLYLSPRTPRSIDEQTIQETTKSRFPNHLFIRNFKINEDTGARIKYEPIIKQQSVKNKKLTLKYDASVTEECALTTPTEEEYINQGTAIDNLVERYNAGYMVSEDTLDEPVQGKTMLLEYPINILNVGGKKSFEFNPSIGRQYIKTTKSKGSDAFNNDVGYSLFIRFKPNETPTINPSVLISKWTETQEFVSPTSSFKLLTNGWQVNEDTSIKKFGEYVNRNQWNNLMITQNPVEKILKIYINGEVLEFNNFPDMIKGNEPLIIGGYFSDVNKFEGFSGLIDDVRIYDVPLNSELVSIIFDQTDFESNKKDYDLFPPYQVRDQLVSDLYPVEKLQFHRGGYIPEKTMTRVSENLSTMIVGELNTTQFDETSLTLNIYRRSKNKWEFVFEHYTTNFTNFYFCNDYVVMTSNTRLAVYAINYNDKKLSEKSVISIKLALDVEPIVFEAEQPFATNSYTENDPLLGCCADRIWNKQKSVFLFVTNEKYEIALYNVSNNMRLIRNETQKNVLNEIKKKINKVTIKDNQIAIYATGGNVYFKRIENNKLVYVGVKNIVDSLDMFDIKLLKNHENEYQLLTVHRGQKIAEYDTKYKIAKNAELDTAYIKVRKIKLIEHTLEKNTAAYLKTFGILNGGVIQPEKDILHTETTQILTPPYSEFGTELLENFSFGNEIIINNKDLFVASNEAFENSEGTYSGIAYWYKYSDELNEYVFVSRVFDNSEEGRQNFGEKMVASGGRLFVVSSYLNSTKSGDDLWFGQSFIYNTNNITEDLLNEYSISNDTFEKYDDQFKLEAWYRFNDIYAYKAQTMFAREKYVVLDHSGNYNHLNCYFRISPRKETFNGPLEGDMTYKFERSSHCNVNLDLKSTSFTLNIWYLVEDFKDDQSVLLSMYDTENIGSDKGFILYANGNFTTGSNLNLVPLEIPVVQNTYEWLMLTITYDVQNKQINFFRNTKLIKTINDVTLNFDNNIMSIGGITYTKNPFYGYIDDIKVYKKILDEEDIQYEFEKSWKFQWLKT